MVVREGQVVYTDDYRKIAIQVPIVPLLVVAASVLTKALFFRGKLGIRGCGG